VLTTLTCQALRCDN